MNLNTINLHIRIALDAGWSGSGKGKGEICSSKHKQKTSMWRNYLWCEKCVVVDVEESFHFIYWGWEIENKFSESKLLWARRFIRKLVPETLLLDVLSWALQFDWKNDELRSVDWADLLVFNFSSRMDTFVSHFPSTQRLFNKISDFLLRRQVCWGFVGVASDVIKIQSMFHVVPFIQTFRAIFGSNESHLNFFLCFTELDI